MPLADAVIDIHSGGKTLRFTPSAVVHRLADATLMARTLDALMAFAAPTGLVLTELDAEGMLDTEVEARGKLFLSTELGGGGTAGVETVAIAEIGVRNLLCHFGLIDEAPRSRAARGLPPTRLMHTPDPDCYVASDDRGMFEPLAGLGDEVAAGDPLARVHCFETPGRAPVPYRAPRAGRVICRHHPGLIAPGDCLAVIAEDYAPQ